jgi:hypothetical protein
MEKMGGIWVANFLGRKEESTRFDHTSINEAAKGNTSSGSTTTTTTTTTRLLLHGDRATCREPTKRQSTKSGTRPQDPRTRRERPHE